MNIATNPARPVEVTSRYFQGQSSSTRVGINPETGALLDLGGEEIHIPAGFQCLELQPRLCGDYYAMLDGPKPYAGYGPTAADAVRMALGKVA